jgi:hypothetical protein
VSNAEAAFQLRAGEIVNICAEHHGFALVKSTAGRSGWVSCAEIDRVVPRMSDHSGDAFCVNQ